MTVSEALEKISRALGTLVHQTQAENLSGLFSKNRLSEDLLLPVLRIALNAPNLRNVNQEAVNFPYIDLADELSHLAIQVTSERQAAKVTETISNFIANGYHRRYKRLMFFILTDRKPKYSKASIEKWTKISGRKLRFNPSSDIITTTGLFPIIQALPQPAIYAVHDVISQSVIGDAFVDVGKYLLKQSQFQLESEKKWGKYIPNIFIETQGTKNLARSFAHPVLFFRRTLDSLSRLNIPGCNRLLDKVGLPPLPSLNLRPYYAKSTMVEIYSASLELSEKLLSVSNLLTTYENLKYKDQPPFKIKKDRVHVYEETTINLQQMGWGLKYKFKEILDELAVNHARVFILTGKAGQGKTNFVCDLVENFLWKHAIPCAYLSSRRISAVQTPDLGDTIQRLIFEGKITSFAEAARLLSAHAKSVNKPFVLIIDGLNEHHRLTEFALQLEHFIETIGEYPFLKLLLTCRSEFFQERFGNLTKGPFTGHTFLLKGIEHRGDLHKERYDQLLGGYFKFFRVRRNIVSEHVVESLKKDMLLLRFFCEAYGARGKSKGYQQPRIANIYREQIFQHYLEQKLGSANLFLQRGTGDLDPAIPMADLRIVLEICVRHMLETWQFSDVPVSLIPSGLRNAQFALLDEELILRRDTSPRSSIFSPSSETINFTFDEFRDFLIAQYLLHRVYTTDRSAFLRYVSLGDPKNSQIIEGIKKFLFYASRHEGNEVFFTFYKDQPWYRDVYDEEVFNIEPKYLCGDDRDIVVEALQAGGERARAFARQLAINWHPDDHPVLNLDLFVSLVSRSDDLRYDNLIIETFKTIRHFNDGACAAAFSEFITTKVLPQFKPGFKNPEDSLFRFLILLMPVESGVDLNSACVDAFRELLNRHPSYGIGLLKDALQYKPMRHRPHVWRMLSLVSVYLSHDDPLFTEAQVEQIRTAGTDQVLHREVNRFLERYSPTARNLKS